MDSLRESLSSLPGTLSTFVTDNPISYFLNNTNNSIASSQSEEDGSGSEKTHAIPKALIKEQWQIILGQNASILDLENAIERCKILVLNSDELTDERKWLVRHLVEIRFHLKELKDAADDPNLIPGPSVKVILGHHFMMKVVGILPTSRQYCDHCSGIIWNVVQTSYICTDCNYVVHSKCVEHVLRICAHIVVSERKYPIADICPINPTGLLSQNYKCADCQTALNFMNSWIEPRLCDYSGLFYCSTCHWNDTSIVPARIIHNWDFTSHKVSRASLQEINLFLDKAVINIEEKNEKLFMLMEKLNKIKKQRENLFFMKKYLSECRIACENKLIDLQIGSRRHLIQSCDIYSISDLIQAESGILIDYLNKMYNSFGDHIKNCDICYGKGYICEICHNKKVMFPFDEGCVYCEKCNSIYHHSCWTTKKSICKKCLRLEERKNQTDNIE